MLQPFPPRSAKALRLTLPLLLIGWLLLSGWASATEGTHAWQNTTWLECADTQPPQDEDSDEPGSGATDRPDYAFGAPILFPSLQQRHGLQPGHGDPAPRAPPASLPV